MEVETIILYEALKWMDKQKTPFRIEFIKTSMDKRTGGQVRVVNRALRAANQKNSVDEHMVGFRDLDKPDDPPMHTYIYSLCFVNGKKIVL
jgi:hypothetical protein